jgi:hypothetical protein
MGGLSIKTLLYLAGAWLVIAALAAVVVALQRDPEPVAPSASLFTDPGSVVVEAKGPSQGDFVARPLFVSTRAPFEPLPPTSGDDTPMSQEEKAESALDVKLRGTFGSGAHRGVLLTDAERQHHRLLVGDDIAGWQLVAVDTREAVFKAPDGKEERIELALSSGAGMAPPPDGSAEDGDIVRGRVQGVIAVPGTAKPVAADSDANNAKESTTDAAEEPPAEAPPPGSFGAFQSQKRKSGRGE